ncbi:MAG TPA: phage holin family protein [Planosporangium sp.]|jgi:putative membrane protein|nr:phage holin family protein [Planosporangium sp.]
MGILIRLAVSAVAVWISTLVLKGITLGDVNTVKKIGTLLLVAAIFGLVNAVLRPVIKVLGCWAYVLTLGLVALVVNGLLFLLTSWIAGQLGLPFHVDRFWPTAVLGALLVSVISWVFNLVVPDRNEK